jgi:hypothetical protein
MAACAAHVTRHIAQRLRFLSARATNRLRVAVTLAGRKRVRAWPVDRFSQATWFRRTALAGAVSLAAAPPRAVRALPRLVAGCCWLPVAQPPVTACFYTHHARCCAVKPSALPPPPPRCRLPTYCGSIVHCCRVTHILPRVVRPPSETAAPQATKAAGTATTVTRRTCAYATLGARQRRRVTAF